MKTIFHIPHSSTYIPPEYLHEYLVSPDELDKINNIMVDSGIIDLVDYEDSIIFPYSRLFCDVERFNSDKEPMNDIGMGVLYTHDHKLRLMRKNPSKDIIKYYDEHHRKLNNRVTEVLENHNEVLFIDLHSYAKYPVEYEMNKHLNRPQVGIGVNDNHNKRYLNDLIYIIKSYDFEYAINEPFSGCLIPSEYTDNPRVSGFMLELRKDVCEKYPKKLKEMLLCIKDISRNSNNISLTTN